MLHFLLQKFKVDEKKLLDSPHDSDLFWIINGSKLNSLADVDFYVILTPKKMSPGKVKWYIISSGYLREPICVGGELATL